MCTGVDRAKGSPEGLCYPEGAKQRGCDKLGKSCSCGEDPASRMAQQGRSWKSERACLSSRPLPATPPIC